MKNYIKVYENYFFSQAVMPILSGFLALAGIADQKSADDNFPASIYTIRR